MMTPKEYRERLLQRQKQEYADKGKTGLGRKSILDYSRAVGKIVNQFSPKYKPEENAIDIIPFITTQPWYKKLRTPSGRDNGLDTGCLEYKLQVPIHKNIGINGNMFLCLRKAFGDACALCDEMFSAYQTGDKDKAYDLKPSWRTFYNVYDYDDPDKGIQIFDISYYLFESTTKNDPQRANLIDAMMLDDSGPVPFFDLTEGKIIIAKFKKKTFGKNEFPEIDDIQFEDRSEPYDESILSKVFPLDSMLVISTNEEMKNAYYALEEDKTKEDLEPPQEMEQARGRGRVIEQEIKEEGPAPEITREKRTTRNIEPEKDNLCPAGKVFGKDFNTGPECEGKTPNACDEETFDRCSKAHAGDLNSQKEEEVVKQEEPAPTERRRRR